MELRRLQWCCCCSGQLEDGRLEARLEADRVEGANPNSNPNPNPNPANCNPNPNPNLEADRVEGEVEEIEQVGAALACELAKLRDDTRR